MLTLPDDVTGNAQVETVTCAQAAVNTKATSARESSNIRRAPCMPHRITHSTIKGLSSPELFAGHGTIKAGDYSQACGKLVGY